MAAATLQNQNLVFSEIERLAEYLSKGISNGQDVPTGTVDPKRYPIVLVPGFLGWASPMFGYSYFGGLVNLAEVLASQGWSVICPQVGPVSSNWERACELYSQLARGSMDGTTYDICVDYGVSLPGTNVFYSYPPPLRRQAACFNLSPTWCWGPSSPVHLIAHSQGGNTCRYLIHLLERGWSSEGSSYFTEPKYGWVKSLTTLATPHNGTSIIPVLGDLGDIEDVLLDKIICAASFLRQKHRTFDFCLDHRGLGPPPPVDGVEVDFLTYCAMLSAPDGPLTRWRQSTYNGFYDNSIVGVVGDLNKIIGKPSEDVYYFTLSFAATVEVPMVDLDILDMLALPEGIVKTLGGWLEKIGLGGALEKMGLAGFVSGGAPVMSVPVPVPGGVPVPVPVVSSAPAPGSTTQGLVDRLPGSVASKLPTSLLSKLNISTPSRPTTPPQHPKPPATWASAPAIPAAYTAAINSQANGSSYSARRFLVTFLSILFGPTLQGIATFALKRLNSRLPQNHQAPTLPLPTLVPNSTAPRLDLNPLFLPVAYPMCSYNLSPTEKELISAAGGPIDDALWREHDGVVPTVSMSGPFGGGNRVFTVGEIIAGGHVCMEGEGRELKGVWVDLGKCGWWDHMDCIGSCINPVTVWEAVELYERIGRLLSVLPVDKSIGERR